MLCKSNSYFLIFAKVNNVQSMTGFGKSSMENTEIAVTCEARSLNGKFIEIDIRLPKHLYEIDVEIRKAVGDMLKRGSVVLVFNISNKPNTLGQKITVSEKVAKEYYTQLSGLQKAIGLESKDLFGEIIRMPDIIQTSEAGYSDESKSLIVATAVEAAKQLINFRTAEGKSIAIDLKKHVEDIEARVALIDEHEIPRKEALKEKMYGNLSQHKDQDKLDENRFEQEMLYYLDKWDISEEKTRLKQHLSYFKDTMDTPFCGKKLYFICQEMNREANTLGVKSNYFAMQQIIVEVKERLEQIKEQVMNVV